MDLQFWGDCNSKSYLRKLRLIIIVFIEPPEDKDMDKTCPLLLRNFNERYRSHKGLTKT